MGSGLAGRYFLSFSFMANFKSRVCMVFDVLPSFSSWSCKDELDGCYTRLAAPIKIKIPKHMFAVLLASSPPLFCLSFFFPSHFFFFCNTHKASYSALWGVRLLAPSPPIQKLVVDTVVEEISQVTRALGRYTIQGLASMNVCIAWNGGLYNNVFKPWNILPKDGVGSI